MFLVIAAALAAFGLTSLGSFHFDDYALLTDPAVASSSGAWEVWRFAQTRPLTYFTFWANYQLGGADPLGYHLVNLAVHLSASALLLITLPKLIGSRVALTAALLFAIHPIQTEAVAYVFARATLLSALLCVLTLWLWLEDRRWLAVAAFALALLAKEECAAFPLFLLFLSSTSRGASFSLRRASARPIEAEGLDFRKLAAPLSLMLLLALSAVLRVAFITRQVHGSGAGSGSTVTPLQYASVQGYAILRYLAMLIVPWGYTIDPDLHPPMWLRVLAWTILLAIVAFAARCIGVDRPSLWLLSGLILLIPTSTIFPADDLAADRRMYLPMIAFSVCAAMLLKRWRPAAIAAVFAILAVVSVRYSLTWKTEASLWTEAIRRSPAKIRPRIQLSRAVPAVDALAVLEQARSIAPGHPGLASEEARVYLELGRPAEALAAFGRALAASPGEPLAINNRGVALAALGQADAARLDFERALAINPCLFDARLNLKRLGGSPPAARCRFTPLQETQLAAP